MPTFDFKQEAAVACTKGDWSSGMIPVLGTGGPGFNSRIAPFYPLPHPRPSHLFPSFTLLSPPVPFPTTNPLPISQQ